MVDLEQGGVCTLSQMELLKGNETEGAAKSQRQSDTYLVVI